MTELRPCPFCGSDFLTLHVDRMHTVSITCGCGASVSVDCSRCSDPTVGDLVDSLAGMWNRRTGE